MTAAQHTTLRWLIYSLVVIVITMIGMGLAIVWYANYVDTESNRRWCGIVTTMDDAYAQNPQTPTSPIGKKIALEMKELRKSFGC